MKTISASASVLGPPAWALSLDPAGESFPTSRSVHSAVCSYTEFFLKKPCTVAFVLMLLSVIRVVGCYGRLMVNTSRLRGQRLYISSRVVVGCGYWHHDVYHQRQAGTRSLDRHGVHTWEENGKVESSLKWNNNLMWICRSSSVVWKLNKKLSYCCDSRSYCMQYFNAVHCEHNISTSE